MKPDELPVLSLFDGVVGQDAAVAFLRASAAAPVHAYLFLGPDSAGALAAARGFAAAVLCPNGGDGTCSACVRALHGTHPDLAVVERSGASILVDEAREVTRLALRSPMEGGRKVLVLTDFHAVEEAAPALLKTIEEPPPSAVFIVLADQVTPDLVTIASRCVRVEFPPLPDEMVADVLVNEGVARDVAVESAAIACGSIARARQVAADQPMRDRMAVWRAVPDRLDGSAGAVVAVAGALTELIDGAAAPVIEQQKREDAELAERAKAGMPVPSRRDLEVRQRRAQRRARTDDLRAGLAVLSAVYRDRAAAADRVDARRALVALDAIAQAADDMQYNPNEMPLLEGLLARISS
ncbi:MAG: polymerase subunit delta [Actinomycetota bacterium]|jgi:DNA polymerase-3 subunit delta'